MKIQLLSDLHLEFFRSGTKTKNFVDSLHATTDVLILAGDITVMAGLSHYLELFCDIWPEVVYVPGNHEYFHSSFEDVHKQLEDLATKKENFHWLNNSETTINGQRFLGGTLWFPLTAQSSSEALQSQLNDFRLIKDFKDIVFQEHDKTRKYLVNNMKSDDIVVLHHLPHKGCIAPQYFNSPLNCFFYANIDDIIEDKQPKMVFGGHTHSSYKFAVNKTMVMANPYGYHNLATNKDFIKHFVVEIL